METRFRFPPLIVAVDGFFELELWLLVLLIAERTRDIDSFTLYVCFPDSVMITSGDYTPSLLSPLLLLLLFTALLKSTYDCLSSSAKRWNSFSRSI